MLCVLTELRSSPIHGFGVFLLQDVKKGGLIWRYQPGFDQTYTQKDLEALPELARNFIVTYGFYCKGEDSWILPGDYDRHTNHSGHPTTFTLSDNPNMM